jgi:hypothetical protein
MHRLLCLTLSILLVTGCATPTGGADAPPVPCEDIDDAQCIERHRGALKLCHRYHDQCQRRAEQRAREAELYQWVATGASAATVVLGATLITFAATPADL